MTSTIVSLALDAGIAIVTIDNPPVNTIDAAVRAGLVEALDAIAAAGTSGNAPRAVAIVANGSTFCSGADIGEFNGPPQEAAYRAIFGRIEQLALPVVVGLHGTVMGGGLELALACHYRVAAEGTRLGLPEVTLGIIPGAGGTQRLPRLVGVDKALELIVGAKPIDAPQALTAGVVDLVCPAGTVREATLDHARSLLARGAGPRRSSERSVDPASGTPEVLEKYRALARKLYPNRKAALTAIESVAASLTLPFEAGLMNEDRLVNLAKATTESKALVHAFFADRTTRKLSGTAATGKPRTVARAAIIGAGTMGGGIAICFANAGIPVTLLDIDAAALARGLATVDATYESMVKRGRITAADKTARLALIQGSLSYDDLRSADVIIEAAVERMDLKKKIFAALDAVAKPGAVLATNTSTLDVEDIGSATRRPQDVIGMHFFSPANVMPLLEVIRTTHTSADTIRTVMDLAKPLRKTPVLAKVCYGFIGNRMMEGYAREAERIVLEGATPRQVDSALEEWGMAMGILAVFDMAGVDVGVHVHAANPAQYPPDPTYYQADAALFAAGRMGQKNGKGYYRYVPGDRSRHDDPEAIAILRATAQRLAVAQRTHSAQEIIERCLYPLMNEGLRILEEGVAQRASDIDVVWTAGYGFPRYRGGPMFHAQAIGLPTLLAGIEKYRAQFGPMHWQPAPLLERLVREGRTIGEWEAL